MANTQEYDELIKACVAEAWPEQDWLLIKAQIKQESTFNPKAISECGACGLLQLMPPTAKDLGIMDIFDPFDNVTHGVLYLRQQYDHFPEISDPNERIKFALAAYNAGRGNINHAIQFTSRIGVDCAKWINVGLNLEHITGPDNATQTLNYVSQILRYWTEYREDLI